MRQNVSETSKKALSVYSYKQRQSRPRVKKNILQPEQVKENNHCVVHDDQDYK
jgi:hypothetical protein